MRDISVEDILNMAPQAGSFTPFSLYEAFMAAWEKTAGAYKAAELAGDIAAQLGAYSAGRVSNSWILASGGMKYYRSIRKGAAYIGVSIKACGIFDLAYYAMSAFSEKEFALEIPFKAANPARVVVVAKADAAGALACVRSCLDKMSDSKKQRDIRGYSEDGLIGDMAEAGRRLSRMLLEEYYKRTGKCTNGK